MKYTYRHYPELYRKVYPFIIMGLFFILYCYKNDLYLLGSLFAITTLCGYLYSERYFQLRSNIDVQGISFSFGRFKTVYKWQHIRSVKVGESGIELTLNNKKTMDPIIIPVTVDENHHYYKFLGYLKRLCKENQIEVFLQS